MSAPIGPSRIQARCLDATLRQVQILRGITLDAPAGSIVGVLGPNGSGKSTLLRALFRSLRPSAGDVLIDDESIATWPVRRVAEHVAVVLQDMPSEFPLSAMDVVRTGRSPHKRALESETESDRAICAAALDVMQVGLLAHAPFAELSGGERQRILIARALAQQPRVLIMDEPTNHLDLHHQLDLLEVVRSLDVTAVIALHDLNLASRFCDQLVLLHDGAVAADGRPEDIVVPDVIERVYRVRAQVITHPTTGAPHVIAL